MATLRLPSGASFSPPPCPPPYFELYLATPSTLLGDRPPSPYFAPATSATTSASSLPASPLRDPDSPDCPRSWTAYYLFISAFTPSTVIPSSYSRDVPHTR